MMQRHGIERGQIMRMTDGPYVLHSEAQALIEAVEAEKDAAIKKRDDWLKRAENYIGQANDAEAERDTLRAENARLAKRVEELEADSVKLCQAIKDATDGELMSNCESCGAPLFESDDFVSDPDGVSGCWHTMTDIKSKRERPCYAYRVGKASADRTTLASEPRS